MPYDVNLILDQGHTITADGDGPVLDCEGGQLVWVRNYWGAMSGGGSTLDVRVLVSSDAGSNYYMYGKFQQLGPTNDNLEAAIPVYIPPPQTPGQMVKVKLNFDIGGSGTYILTLSAIEPMVSLAPPDLDLKVGGQSTANGGGALGATYRVASV